MNKSAAPKNTPPGGSRYKKSLEPTNMITGGDNNPESQKVRKRRTTKNTLKQSHVKQKDTNNVQPNTNNSSQGQPSSLLSSIGQSISTSVRSYCDVLLQNHTSYSFANPYVYLSGGRGQPNDHGNQAQNDKKNILVSILNEISSYLFSIKNVPAIIATNTAAKRISCGTPLVCLLLLISLYFFRVELL